jgi:hypothetical protein
MRIKASSSVCRTACFAKVEIAGFAMIKHFIFIVVVSVSIGATCVESRITHPSVLVVRKLLKLLEGNWSQGVGMSLASVGISTCLAIVKVSLEAMVQLFLRISSVLCGVRLHAALTACEVSSITPKTTPVVRL